MENIYEDIINSIEDGIVVFDKIKRVTLFNQVTETITGISRNKALQAPGDEVFSDNSHLMEQVSRTLETGQVYSDHDSYIFRRNRTPVPVSITTSPIISGEGASKGTALVIRDISRVKTLEEEVKRSDSLASVGILAAGLAHEIRNPLGGIRGSAQLLGMEVGHDEELKEYTSVIIKETDRVSRLLDELLDFSNPKQLTLEELNIHEVLDSVIRVLSASKGGKAIQFITEYDPSIPAVAGDHEKLVQVFINIVKNACEAMEGEGSLTIVTRYISDFVLHHNEGGRSKMISIEVSDKGKGISADDIDALFTPFFTKKKGGTGLGLAVTQRIVKEHGGAIKVQSEEGEGSTFSVLLPTV